MTALLEVNYRFIVVPRLRGQQLKDTGSSAPQHREFAEPNAAIRQGKRFACLDYHLPGKRNPPHPA